MFHFTWVFELFAWGDMWYVGLQLIIQDVVFPLLCHNSEDEQLWNSDPIEYIRTKYGEIEVLLITANIKLMLILDYICAVQMLLRTADWCFILFDFSNTTTVHPLLSVVFDVIYSSASLLQFTDF